MTSTIPQIEAAGKVITASDGIVVFKPTGTNYQLHLAGNYDGKLNVPVKAVIRAAARKIWTVPSGGNFIAPILGTPRTLQGLVRALDSQSMVVQAGTPVLIEFPSDDSAFDLASGAISVGTMVNVVAQPGARIEIR